ALTDGHISRFHVIGGCDGGEGERSYYTDLTKALPDTSVVLTVGCYKFRINHLHMGTIGGERSYYTDLTKACRRPAVDDLERLNGDRWLVARRDAEDVDSCHDEAVDLASPGLGEAIRLRGTHGVEQELFDNGIVVGIWCIGSGVVVFVAYHRVRFVHGARS
ncbi:hypothetical protein DYB38_013974, partial [Aphanomyces astaci]